MNSKYGETLAISHVPAGIKKRLKLEGFRQNITVRELVLKILDEVLPGFEELIKDNNAANGQANKPLETVQTKSSLNR